MIFEPQVKKIAGANHTWLGSAHGVANAQTGTLKADAFGGKDVIIPSGTPVKINSDGLLEPVKAEGDKLAGFILDDVKNAGDGNVIAYIWHGRILADRLPEGAFDVSTLTDANPQFTIVKDGK